MPFVNSITTVNRPCGYIGKNTSSDTNAVYLSFYSANGYAQISASDGGYMIANQVTNGCWITGVAEYYVA